MSSQPSGRSELHGVGIDVADVRRLARLVERGERFTRRWFTGEEVAQCAVAAVPAAAYAACFAGKEAVWKALGLSWDGPVPWRWIEIVADPAGTSAVALSGPVAVAAEKAGVSSVAVTTTVASPLASAMAVAWHRSGT